MDALCLVGNFVVVFNAHGTIVRLITVDNLAPLFAILG